MKRFLILVLVFAAVFSVSCSGKKKEKPSFEEQVSKEIKAEEGGKIESSDGKMSVEIPAGALEGDTTITMTVYDALGYSDENGKIVSKVVEFEPSGTIFKKPVIITMTAGEDVKEKTISAAVYNEAEEKWSYSQGFYVILKKNEAGGDPIMETTDGKEIALDNGNLTTAGGDPIMMTNAAGDPIMTNAAGDPIMMSAAGDPIMLASENAAGDPIMMNAAGDPIMTSAAGDPIMNAAAGDPIMMTTGHFTSFTFIAFEPRKGEPVEPADDNEPVDDSDTVISDDDTGTSDNDIPDEEITDIDDDDTDTADNDIDTEITDIDDTDTAEPDGDTEPVDNDVVSEPELVYSKVLCTGKSICNDDNNQILCPAEGEDFYGQDAQYAARKGCIPHSYTTLPKPEEYNETDYIDQIHDNVTGLTWIIDIRERRLSYMNQTEDPCGEEYSEYSYLGSGWRLPTTKEVMTLTDHSILYDALIDQTYFTYLRNIWTAERFIYQIDDGLVFEPNDSEMPLMWCVRGEEYGKVDENMYEIFGEGSEKVVFDSSTNLIWQKEYAENKTWKEALSYCENLEYAGKNDWRLPNKNELMTLLDLSKEEEPFSSFPDMPADGFWSSTAYDYYDSYNKVLSDGYAWMSYFKGGFVEYIPLYIDEEEVEHYPFQTEHGNALLSVRCVRSALDEKEEIPECNGSGIGSCRDASNGIVWSSRLYPEISSPAVYMGEDYGSGGCGSGYGFGGLFFAAVMCRDLNENGSNKWRIPTIEELYTIFSTDRARTALNDSGLLVSGSVQGEGSDCPMFYTIDVTNGSEEVSLDPPVSELVIRCVYDEELDFKKAPYTDPETELTWSEASPTVLSWEDAVDFCYGLNIDDSEHYWRLPTYDELETLNKSSESRFCKKYGNSGYNCFSGEYSLFGDIEQFWLGGGNCGQDGSQLGFNFWEFSGYCFSTEYNLFKARCVSSGPSPCAGDPCASVQNSAGCLPLSESEYRCICAPGFLFDEDENTCVPLSECSESGTAPCVDPENGLVWSTRSPEDMQWRGDADSYCENFDEAGYTDWRTPTIDELRTLVQHCDNTVTNGNCVVSAPDYSTDTWIEENCYCEPNEDDSGYYSRFGDDVTLWSSSQPDSSAVWSINFNYADIFYMYHEDDHAYVRCVRSAE